MANKLFSQLSKGAYDNATAYTVGDFINYLGSSYACIKNGTGNLPTNTTYWALLSSKGDKGDKGNDGADGSNGACVESVAFVGDDMVFTLTDASTVTLVGAKTDLKGENGLDVTWLGEYNAGTTYVVNDAVSYNGSSYICKLESTGNLPTNTTYWDLMARKGTDGAGSGDMIASVYDPTNVASDAFDMDNMVEGTNNKLVSAAEKSGWSGKQDALGFTPENVVNKRTSFQATPTNTAYPSEKLVKDSLDGKVPTTRTITINGTTQDLSENRSWTIAGGFTVGSTTSTATPSIDVDTYNRYSITALATAITSVTITGTPTNFQELVIRIKDDGTARTIAWGSSFEAKGVALPLTTVASKVLTVKFVYDTVTSKWGCVAYTQEA